MHRAEIADRLVRFDQVGHLHHPGHAERGREDPVAFGCGQVAAQRHHAVGGAHVDSAGPLAGDGRAHGFGEPLVGPSEPSLQGFTIYRPKDLTQRASYPLIAWENGGCSLDGLLFVEFLPEISSYGIVIIVDGAPKGSGMGSLSVDGKTLLQAMDWASKQNDQSCSKYYQKLETNNVGAMGQSCGGLHAYAIAKDPRVTLQFFDASLGEAN